eukprot:comp24272_c0_seq1/m.45283 comp24272_c0_seq1/g.45283  ORF comp24272_c0_seq1/g.45283 comp24272_c0_seq1/m.45283 type:complete len:360 (-) comp24272_c0_seq1:434-1513(-)
MSGSPRPSGAWQNAGTLSGFVVAAQREGESTPNPGQALIEERVVGKYQSMADTKGASAPTARADEHVVDIGSSVDVHTHTHVQPSATAVPPTTPAQPTGGIVPMGARQQVRSNVNNEVTQARRASRLSYLLSMVVMVGQIVAGIVVMALYWGTQCEHHLRMYLLMYVDRMMCGCFLRTIDYLQPDPVGSNASSRNRSRVMLDLMTMLVFVLGNVWIVGESACTSSPIYALALTYLILTYLYLAMPVLLCGAVICCLPCVLGVLQFMKENKGVSKEVIKKNTTKVKFHPGLHSPEDCMCVVCLGDYEDKQHLRILPCKHHFHRECVDKWLGLNQACPLCLRNIDGSSQPQANTSNMSAPA